MSIDFTPRCIHCEDKLVNSGRAEVESGLGKIPAKKLRCVNVKCPTKVVLLYMKQLPNMATQMVQKQLTNMF